MEDIPAELLSQTCNVLYDARLAEMNKQIKKLKKEMEPHVEYKCELKHYKRSYKWYVKVTFTINICGIKIIKIFPFEKEHIPKLEQIIKIIKEKIEVKRKIYCEGDFGLDVNGMYMRDDYFVNSRYHMEIQDIPQDIMLPALEEKYRLLINMSNI